MTVKFVFINEVEQDKSVLEITPFIKFTDNFCYFTNLFKIKMVENGFSCNLCYKNLILCYSTQFYDKGVVLCNFTIKNNSDVDINLEYLLKCSLDAVNLLEIKLITELFIENNSLNNLYVYELKGNGKGVFYFVTDKSVFVEFNGQKFNGKTNKNKIELIKEQNRLYFDNKITMKKGEKISLDIVIFSSLKELKKYVYFGKKEYFNQSVYIPNFSFEIFSGESLFDACIDKMINSIYENFYYSYQNNVNFIFNLSFLLSFDKNFFEYVEKINTTDIRGKLIKLAMLIQMYLYHEICYETEIIRLASSIKNEDFSINFDTIEEIIYLVECIDKLKNDSILKNLTQLKMRLVSLLKDFDFKSLVKEAVQSENLNEININKIYKILLAEKYIQKDDYNYLKKQLINGNSKAYLSGDYIKCLYLVYDDITKDFIYETIINNSGSDNYLSVLRIIIDKMLGYKVEKNSITVHPNLPTQINKIVLNHRFKNGLYTYIAKRCQYCFSVNDVEFKRAVKVKLKKGYAKIICGSN